MPVCESVSILAEELDSQLRDLSQAEKTRLDALKNMPKYLEKMRLDLFDQDFTDGYSDEENEETKNFRAIEVLGELAFENMYVAFSKGDTMRAYKWAIKELGKLGLNVSSSLDMSEL